ncbi:dihydrolipoamide acetyltransferase family protein [Namhaeicola litoreus]|uniref:Dihydrolipoamide acetyltransferase component of pyruvate dehydrogenase complex n=1 Tax=Namhaeicola litoreus TaxID=1052145 RepID=A0ABW3Y170_9FLAO
MSKFELKLPKMGESVAEATITSWLKEVGEKISLDEPVVEIATDKVDSEVPSEVEGVLLERLFNVDDVVKVGETIAVIEINSNGENLSVDKPDKVDQDDQAELEAMEPIAEKIEKDIEGVKEQIEFKNSSGKFYSPLVKNIARAENISMEELESIVGTGKEDRVTKTDILAYIENRNKGTKPEKIAIVSSTESPKQAAVQTPQISYTGSDQVIEMTRMGKLIAKHMVDSKQTSAHVQSFVEVDVTNIVKWRDKVKDAYLKREGEKITYTPIFMQAVAKALKDFPMMNISVDGEKIIQKKNINLGMAAALPDGNLIVPVIKNADTLSLIGMTKVVNDLAVRARNGKLNPDDIQGGTYTVTNVGTFGSIMGTPIINQPQVGILALGSIRKLPSVIETPDGDFIGIRHKMIISHSYDHRVVNGALGSMFARKVADYLEAWDTNADF